MNMQTLRSSIAKSFFTKSAFFKTLLASAALGGLLLAGAPGAKASAWDDCNRRVSYTEYRYHVAAERFGPYSRDARYWALERREAFVRAERCRHQWR